jgi:hypothetical protein
MVDWQPIETAPRGYPLDGGSIMLWGPQMSVGIGWWNDEPGAGMEPYWANNCQIGHDDYCEPTHWAPLPEPPKSQRP